MAGGSTDSCLSVRIDDRIHRFQFVSGNQDRLLASGNCSAAGPRGGGLARPAAPLSPGSGQESLPL